MQTNTSPPRFTDFKHTLRSAGRKQRDIAEACQVSAPTVSRWVEWIETRGAAGTPIPAGKLMTIATLAAVPVTEILPPASGVAK